MRDASASEVDELMESMQKFPHAAHDTLGVNVETSDAPGTILDNVENYKFYTVTGNHRRLAVKQLAAAQPDNMVWQSRKCTVYRNLTRDEEEYVSVSL